MMALTDTQIVRFGSKADITKMFLSECLPLLSRARYKRYKTEARRHSPDTNCM
jgi:hypothetical protein